MEKGIIMVDCAVHSSKKDERGYSFQNLFYYFKVEDGSQIGQPIKNEMYIPFEKI